MVAMRGAVVLNRIIPALGPQAFKTYSWQQPLHTHFHRVTCAEVQCKNFQFGWVTIVDIATELGQQQYDYLSHDKSRSWSMDRAGDTLISFTYEPGNEFFDGSPEHEHYRPIGYDPVVLVQGGDWRGNPRGTATRIHSSIENWVDDFANHQEQLTKAQG